MWHQLPDTLLQDILSHFAPPDPFGDADESPEFQESKDYTHHYHARTLLAFCDKKP
jgi:hypothetical protein